MNQVVSIILGGGQGTRLFPLTNTRCKPAISFGGRYRLIDIPVSNALNAGCTKIFIITQFLSTQLHHHIFQTYHLGHFFNGSIEILSAEQKPSRNVWFQGTADAVRQNLEYFNECFADYYLILSGDQLYNLDFRPMLEFAQETDADLVIASLPINEERAKRMGIMKINTKNQIIDFSEKPQDPKILQKLKLKESFLKKMGIVENDDPFYLGSMGIYLFKRKVLQKLLETDSREDFGKHLIPSMVSQGNTYAYIYNTYWEDIGTISSFYQANIELTHQTPTFNCYDHQNPIHTLRHNLPGPKMSGTYIQDAIICEGSVVDAQKVVNSILGPRTVLKKGCVIEDSYVMGNDFYSPPIKNSNHLPDQLSIEENCVIKRAIIDKNVFLGKGVKLINKNKIDHYDGDNIFIRDGIIVVTRGASLPAGFEL